MWAGNTSLYGPPLMLVLQTPIYCNELYNWKIQLYYATILLYNNTIYNTYIHPYHTTIQCSCTDTTFLHNTELCLSSCPLQSPMQPRIQMWNKYPKLAKLGVVSQNICFIFPSIFRKYLFYLFLNYHKISVLSFP